MRIFNFCYRYFAPNGAIEREILSCKDKILVENQINRLRLFR